MTKTLLLTLTLAASMTSMRAGNVLLNSDFESGNLNGWAAFVTPHGSSGGSGFPAVISFNTTGSGSSLAAEFNVGKSSASTNSEGGWIQQGLTLATGGTYTFFANIASQDDASGQVNGDPGTFSIVIDGVTLATNQLGGGAGFTSAFQILNGTLSGTANLSAGGHTFEVLITRTSFNGGDSTPTEFVDNVSLTSTATPEPASFGLMALPLLGLAASFVRRRRLV